jgi:RNA recognition motif-containing protein
VPTARDLLYLSSLGPRRPALFGQSNLNQICFEPGDGWLLQLSCFKRVRCVSVDARILFSVSNRMSKIYVGNLPFTATEATVRELFAQHGAVESVALITDRDTGQPRGFGFVEMPRTDAARAIQSLNGQDMGGRALKVNEAQDKPRGNAGGQRR